MIPSSLYSKLLFIIDSSKKRCRFEKCEKTPSPEECIQRDVKDRMDVQLATELTYTNPPQSGQFSSDTNGFVKQVDIRSAESLLRLD
jgi:hypothetical protein